jgi:hypothetical protein
MMTIRRIICWLKREHTNPRLFGTNSQTGAESWVCRDCLATWTEYNTTGVHFV